MTEEASLSELRNQLEIAQQLAKSRIGFVVVPVATRAGFEKLCVHQAARLLAIANEAEQAQEQNR